jgi:hypothetical protein
MRLKPGNILYWGSLAAFAYYMLVYKPKRDRELSLQQMFQSPGVIGVRG